MYVTVLRCMKVLRTIYAKHRLWEFRSLEMTVREPTRIRTRDILKNKNNIIITIILTVSSLGRRLHLDWVVVVITSVQSRNAR